jgi:hypothetical protein
VIVEGGRAFATPIECLREECSLSGPTSAVEKAIEERAPSWWGISSSARYGIDHASAFTHSVLNQANALVNIDLGGSIQVSTGGMERSAWISVRVASSDIPSVDRGSTSARRPSRPLPARRQGRQLA